MKGQSKALELVLALFVLLIVAFVVIQVFQKFITSGTSKLEGIEAEQRLKEQFNQVKAICEQKCTIYKQQKCTTSALVDFCSYSAEKIDIDGSGSSIGYTENSVVDFSLGGYGVCKERIPCFLIIQCSCTDTAKPIDAKRCKDSICDHFSGLGVSGSRLDEIVNEKLAPGDCFDYITQKLHWYALAFPGKNSGQLSCSAE